MVPAGSRRDSFSLVETRGRQDRPTREETARPCAVDLYSRPSLALSRFLLRDAMRSCKNRSAAPTPPDPLFRNLLTCPKEAERFARQEPPLQTARQQQRPLPVAGGGSCCWRRALVFQAAFAAQEKPAQRKRRADLAGPDLLRLTNICGGTCALANIGARRQQRLAVSATGGASALLPGKPGRRPQEQPVSV